VTHSALIFAECQKLSIKVGPHCAFGASGDVHGNLEKPPCNPLIPSVLAFYGGSVKDKWF
jgi:hypothetical protein